MFMFKTHWNLNSWISWISFYYTYILFRFIFYSQFSAFTIHFLLISKHFGCERHFDTIRYTPMIIDLTRLYISLRLFFRKKYNFLFIFIEHWYDEWYAEDCGKFRLLTDNIKMESEKIKKIIFNITCATILFFEVIVLRWKFVCYCLNAFE